MTSVYRFDSVFRSDQPQTAKLTIRRGWVRNRFAYRYSTQEFLVGSPSDHLDFELVYGWCMHGLTIDIRDHCCTRPTAISRQPLCPGEVLPNDGRYGDGVVRARYGFTLCERELVSIGLLVRIRKGQEVLGHLLCDPQIGNGPPASARGFIQVPLLRLQTR